MTGELKNKIDALWDLFAAGGLVNPLDVVEQITYLMFLRDLEESDSRKKKEQAELNLPFVSLFPEKVMFNGQMIPGESLKWSNLRSRAPEETFQLMREAVFPFLKSLGTDGSSAYTTYMSDAVFKIPAPSLLSSVLDTLDRIYARTKRLPNPDIRGDVYEYLLSRISQSGRNGQFRTPRHIIRMMVQLAAPSPDETICDPACGTSGFLTAAGEYLKKNFQAEIFMDRQRREHYLNAMFTGYDIDRTMLRIGTMNMILHGVENPKIEYHDSLSERNTDKEKYSLILANPPFKGSLDPSTLAPDLLKLCKTKKTELLFLALFLRLLKVGGRCVCVVPDGVLFGSSRAHIAIRKELVDGNRLEAVISMPAGVFKPYAGVSTGILLFTKTAHGGTDKVWFYGMTADGFTLDDKRTPVKENDIPDILARYANPETEKDRTRSERSFFVTREEIAQNGYDLSINRYKKDAYAPVSYPSSSEILDELSALENQISAELKALKKLL